MNSITSVNSKLCRAKPRPAASTASAHRIHHQHDDEHHHRRQGRLPQVAGFEPEKLYVVQLDEKRQVEPAANAPGHQLQLAAGKQAVQEPGRVTRPALTGAPARVSVRSSSPP